MVEKNPDLLQYIIYYNFHGTLWFQLEDMFQVIDTPQGIEQITVWERPRETNRIEPVTRPGYV